MITARGRQAFRDDAGAAIQAFTTEAFLGPGHTISPLLADTTRLQFVDLPLVLLATFDTKAAVDLRADLPGISVPALVIQGDADQNNPLELTGRRAAQVIPFPAHDWSYSRARATACTEARHSDTRPRSSTSPQPSRRRRPADPPATKKKTGSSVPHTARTSPLI